MIEVYPVPEEIPELVACRSGHSSFGTKWSVQTNIQHFSLLSCSVPFVLSFVSMRRFHFVFVCVAALAGEWVPPRHQIPSPLPPPKSGYAGYTVALFYLSFLLFFPFIIFSFISLLLESFIWIDFIILVLV